MKHIFKKIAVFLVTLGICLSISSVSFAWGNPENPGPPWDPPAPWSGPWPGGK